MSAAETTQTSGSSNSGKLLIVGILVLAIVLAAVSWWFRFNATHRAVKFWGAEAATIIRDAPVVSIYHPGNFSDPATPAMMAKVEMKEFEISHAHGLTYLRNALLEDHNFDWAKTTKEPLPTKEHWGLMFADTKAAKSATVWLSDDFQRLSRPNENDMDSVSVDPVMAKGLREMFTEFTAEAAKEAAAEPSSKAAPAR